MAFQRWSRIVPPLLGAAVIAATVYWGGRILAHKRQAATPPVDVLAHMGVVDMDRLVAAHPDSAKLQEIDREIGYVDSEMNSMGMDPSVQVAEIKRRLGAVQKALQGQFARDLAAVQAQMAARKQSVESALADEAQSVKQQLEAYQRQLVAQAGGAGPEPAPPAMRKDLQAEMARYQQRLLLAAASQLKVRQLELQQQVDGVLAGERSKMEARIQRQTDTVVHADAAQKVQLQLDAQTAPTDDARKKLQAQLQAINDQEEAERERARAQEMVKFEAVRTAQMKKVRANLSAYQAQLSAEVRQKMAAHERELVGRLGGAPSAVAVSDLNRKMQAREAMLKQQFDARKAALVGELKAASDAAQQRLRDEQVAMTHKLQDEKQRIIQEVVKAQGKLSAEDQKRQAVLKTQLDELKARRKGVYEGIVAQIRASVKSLAAQQQIPLVVGGYGVNIGCRDLTDLVLKQLAASGGIVSSPAAH